MNKTVSRSEVKGAIKAPTSKSYLQRALAMALLAKGKSVILDPNYCDDVLAAINVIQDLGAEVKAEADRIVVKSAGDVIPISSEVNCGESGLCARMFAPIIALSGREVTLRVEGSLQKRPLGMVQDALLYLGVDCDTQQGFAPMVIKGPIEPSELEVDGSISSQLLTGLLIALTKAEGVSVVKVDSLKSKPYIDMTLDIINFFGGKVENNNYEVFTVHGEQIFPAKKYRAEGDWSAAAFLLVAGAVSGYIELFGMSFDSKQADMAIVDVLKMVGADVLVDADSILVNRSELKAFEFDATDCPDLFPPLVVLAANCVGQSKIHGTSRLKHKESDRGKVLIEEFSKLGVEVVIDDNTMIVKGGKIKGGKVFSHEDHRIAMATAIAGLNADKPVIIEGTQCVSKSYPEFFEDLKDLGGNVQ